MPKRLRRTRDADLCITRRRSGKGFSFRDAQGHTIRDPEERQRLLGLGIPPAWTDVVICRHANGHIQARGHDAQGRAQYVYHPDWDAQREARKLHRLELLTRLLARVRRQVDEDLSAPRGSAQLAKALAVALIDRTAMRIGRERYLRRNGTRGAATLLKRDVRLKGAIVQLSFTGKGAKPVRYQFKDARIADALRRMMKLPGPRLLAFREKNGRTRPLRPEMINDYLHEICGQDISAKDIRMLHASALAGETLARVEPARSVRGRNRQIADAAKEVAGMLRNTPAISRKSYIAGPILKSFRAGKLEKAWPKRAASRMALKPREQHLRRFLGGRAGPSEPEQAPEH